MNTPVGKWPPLKTAKRVGREFEFCQYKRQTFQASAMFYGLLITIPDKLKSLLRHPVVVLGAERVDLLQGLEHSILEDVGVVFATLLFDHLLLVDQLLDLEQQVPGSLDIFLPRDS